MTTLTLESDEVLAALDCKPGDDYLTGDLWIDSDFLFRPDGSTEPFVTVTIPNLGMVAVPHDEFDAGDRNALQMWEGSRNSFSRSVLQENHDAIAATVPGDWHESCRQFAQQWGTWVIAYRGGSGYCYSLSSV